MKSFLVKPVFISFLSLSLISSSLAYSSDGVSRRSWLKYCGGGIIGLAGGYKVLQITNVPSIENEVYPFHYRYPKPKKVILNPQKLGEDLAKVALRRNSVLEPLSQKYPDMNRYLGGNRQVDYNTYQELPLRDWVLKQPDNTITIERIFEKALELNDNQVGAALLTTHQLLRNEARYKAHYIHYPSDEPSRIRFFNKFTDIRGNLVEAGGIGDHPGSWYRFFGAWLSLYYTSVKKENSVSNLDSNWRTQTAVVSGAEWIKPIIRWKERDTEKASFNRTAVSTGYYFLDHVSN